MRERVMRMAPHIKWCHDCRHAWHARAWQSVDGGWLARMSPLHGILGRRGGLQSSNPPQQSQRHSRQDHWRLAWASGNRVERPRQMFGAASC
jgi:hypothetical protein